MADSGTICKDVPFLLSSFVDTFIDFAFSGVFLPKQENPNPNTSKQSPNPAPIPIQTRYPSPDRLVAIGDLHGDLNKSKQALKLAELIDESDHWIGGNTTVVQVGDVLDRGDDEIKIIYLLEKLKHEASKSGGSLITMNGNHEIMNIDGDFRYITPSSLDEFKLWINWYCLGNSMKNLCKGLEMKQKDIFEGIPRVFPGIRKEFHEGFRARIAALRPNGPISTRFFSNNPTVVVVGDSVFVHGGLLPSHVEYGLDRINHETRDWINGYKGRRSPGFLRGRDAVVWSRRYSDEIAKNCDCSALEHVLKTIPGVKRMIMGHTIQESGINSVCDNRAIRIDVGLSKGCGDGLPEVLEIEGGNNKSSEVRILTSIPVYLKKNYNRSNQNEDLKLLIPQYQPKPIGVKG